MVKRYATITGMKKWLMLGVGLVATFVVMLGLVFIIAGKEKSKVVLPNGTPIVGDNDSIALSPDGAVKSAASEQSPEEQPAGSGEFRLVATGDFIAHDTINARAKDAGLDYSTMLQDMMPYFAKAQAKYCIQATQAGGEAFGISGHPVYNAPVQLVEGMNKLGCNLINMASDHSNDKGQAAIDVNVAAWKTKEVIAVGQYSNQEDRDAISFGTINGLKIAFLAYTMNSAKPPTNSFGVGMYSQDYAKQQMAAAKQGGAQLIIVGMRWGTEYAFDQNATQTAEAQFLADQGADIILGAGPHVAQPVQRLTKAGGGETVVWYSLGNFLHAQLEPETGVNCLATMDIDAASKKVTTVGCLPVYTHYEWPAADEARVNLLGRTNFKVIAADKAAELFPKGYISKKTSLQAQIDRLKTVSNKFTEVKMLTSQDFGL